VSKLIARILGARDTLGLNESDVFPAVSGTFHFRVE
jgi:hypothetical protein